MTARRKRSLDQSFLAVSFLQDAGLLLTHRPEFISEIGPIPAVFFSIEPLTERLRLQVVQTLCDRADLRHDCLNPTFVARRLLIDRIDPPHRSPSAKARIK